MSDWEPKSRLLQVLQGRAADRPPFICPGGMMNMAVTELMDAAGCAWPEAHQDASLMAQLALAAHHIAGIENVGVPFCMTVEAEAMGARIDLGARGTEPSVGAYAIDRPEETARLAPLDLRQGRVRVCIDAIRILRDNAPQTPVIANLTGPVSLATSLLDPMIFYRALIVNKPGAHRLLQAVNAALKRFASAMIEAGADVVCIADPSATGEILGKRAFGEFALPYINELVTDLREQYGVPAIVHICGNVRTLGTMLSEVAAEAVSVDSMVSIKVLKEFAPSKVAMGNVSTYLLAKGNPSRMQRSGEICLQRGAGILAPACGISPKTSLASIRSLAQVVSRLDKVEILFLPQNRVVEAVAGSDMLAVARQANIEIESSCNGMGTCGQCLVQRLDGEPEAPHQDERQVLTAAQLAQGIRLACRQKVKGTATFRAVRSPEKKQRILCAGHLPEFARHPQIGKVHVRADKPSLQDGADDLSRIERALGRPIGNKLSLSVLRQVPGVLRSAGFQAGGLWPAHKPAASSTEDDFSLTAVLSGGELIGLESGDTTRFSYGVAVDIGTTTVVVSLVDLAGGEELAACSCLNPQKSHGLDVLTRIQHVREQPGGLEQLSLLVREAIDALIGDACAEAGVERRHVYEIAVAANSTMMHLFLGVDPTALGRSPYVASFTRGLTVPARELGLRIAAFGEVYALPSVSSFIGADIVAGMVCAELVHKRQRALFVDIGTNGEIVFSSPEGIYACSCAAGPALEGMNISCGVRAADGAIEKVVIDGDVELSTIGNQPPTGLCGTGVLDAVSELLKVGALEPSGRFVKLPPENPAAWAGRLQTDDGPAGFRLSSGDEPGNAIVITQKDVRQVQLAKGAILSGILVLLRQLGIGLAEVDRVYLAGAFGCHVRRESLAGIGILPPELMDRVSLMGNSSKAGAVACLLSQEKREEAVRLAQRVGYIELSCYPEFDRLFSQCLAFPEIGKGPAR
jgi:MtaA/CmuA family methyltransferase